MNRTNFNPDSCWQYEIKTKTAPEDLEVYDSSYIPLNLNEVKFSFIDKSNVETCRKIVHFIERYEWLGKLPVWVTHRFIAEYGVVMIGAVIMSTPNRFSCLLGEDYKNKEKLIARGASISFAPKNTASWLIMNSIRWMVKNTPFRIFTAYADPMAGELGTIYQACNFYYLGQSYGGGYIYINPETEEWYGSSYFSQRSVIKRAAIEAGISWKPEYIKSNKSGSKRIINWNGMLNGTKEAIKDAVKLYKNKFIKVKSKKKHKYVYILGKTKGETLMLRGMFEDLHPNLAKLSYPKDRGI